MSIAPVTVRVIIALALPSVGLAFLTSSHRIVDQYYIQSVSVAAQAALSSAVFVLIGWSALFECVSAGTGPLVARATGADDQLHRRRVLGESLLSSGLFALAIMVWAGLGPEDTAYWLGLQGAAADACSTYLRILGWTVLPMALTPVIDQTFLSLGNARAPLVLHIGALVINALLTPLFMFVCERPVAGVALASSVARGAMVCIGLRQLQRLTGLNRSDLRLTGETWRILRVGSPMGVATGLFAAVYWVLLRTAVSPLGPDVNAALGIGFSALEGFTWPVFHGLALAVASLIGRNLGAGAPELARRAMRLSIPLTLVLGAVAANVFYWAGEWLTAAFTQDAGVHRAATEYAIILSASQLFLAIEAWAEGVLAGAGATQTVFWFSVPIGIMRVPLAYLLAIHWGWGAAGIWWAINITTMVKAALKGWAAWLGRWSRLHI